MDKVEDGFVILDDTFPIAIVKTGLRVMDRFTWFGQPHGHMIIAYDDTHFWVDEEWYGQDRDRLDMTAAVKFHKLVGYSRYNKTAKEQIEYLTRRIDEVGHNLHLRTIMLRSLESIKAGGDRPGKIDASDIVKEMSYKASFMSLDDQGIYSWPKPTVNELRASRNLGPVEGGDVPPSIYQQLQVEGTHV